MLKYTLRKKYIYAKEKQKKKIMIIKRKTILSSLLKKKKDSYNTPDGGPYDNSQGIGAVTVVAKTCTPEVAAILDFLHFI